MVSVDRRGSERVPVKFKVDCIQENDYLISFSKDISADGMFIRTEKPLDVGQKLVLHFSLEDAKELEVAARVVWMNKSGDQKDFGMGVKFIKPKADLKRDILNAVKKIAVLENQA